MNHSRTASIRSKHPYAVLKWISLLVMVGFCTQLLPGQSLQAASSPALGGRWVEARAPLTQTISISPVLECVHNTGTTLIAYYGYSNSSGRIATVAIGSSNSFNPTPADRGQPTRFLVGREVAVFKTEFTSTLTWRLTGRSATASASSFACDERRRDTQPPTTPTNLQVTAQSSTAIALAWDASTDNFDGIRYEIFRDGLIIAATNSLAYTDTTVQPGVTYVYTVRARDGGVNYTPFSDQVTVTLSNE